MVMDFFIGVVRGSQVLFLKRKEAEIASLVLGSLCSLMT